MASRRGFLRGLLGTGTALAAASVPVAVQAAADYPHGTGGDPYPQFDPEPYVDAILDWRVDVKKLRRPIQPSAISVPFGNLPYSVYIRCNDDIPQCPMLDGIAVALGSADQVKRCVAEGNLSAICQAFRQRVLPDAADSFTPETQAKIAAGKFNASRIVSAKYVCDVAQLDGRKLAIAIGSLFTVCGEYQNGVSVAVQQMAVDSRYSDYTTQAYDAAFALEVAIPFRIIQPPAPIRVEVSEMRMPQFHAKIDTFMFDFFWSMEACGQLRLENPDINRELAERQIEMSAKIAQLTGIAHLGG